MVDCRKAWTDLLYKGARFCALAGGSSMSGASKDAVSIVVPKMVNRVPPMELSGELSPPTPI